MYISAINWKHQGKYQLIVQGKIFGKSVDKRKVVSAASLRAAKELAQQFYAELLNNNSPVETNNNKPTVKEITVKDFEPIFIEYLRAKRRKERTLELYKKNFRLHYNPLFGNELLCNITKKHFQKMMSERNHYCADNLKDLLTNLMAIVKLAKAEGYYNGDLPDIKDLRNIKSEKSDDDDNIKWFSKDELNKLLSAAKEINENKHYIMILLGSHAGLRISEIVSVKWDDFDFAQTEKYPNGRITIRRNFYKVISTNGRIDLAQTYTLPKSGKARIVPLTKTLRNALLGAKSRARSPWVFPGAMSGRENISTTTSTAIKWFGRVHKKAFGEPSTHTHRMRHAVAVNLLLAGNNVQLVKQILGHSSLNVTQKYLKLISKQKSEAIEKLDAFLSE